MKDLGDVKYFLSIEIDYQRDLRVLLIHHTKAIDAVFERFGMSDCKEPSTPTEYKESLKSIEKEK